MRFIHQGILASLSICLAGCSTLEIPRPPTAAKPASAGEVAFAKTVKPLIEKRCVWCHSDRKPLAGLNFQDPARILDPGLKFVVPGEPDQSRIYLAVTRENAHPRVMPGDGWGITSEQKAALRQWIESGALWPDGRAGKIRHKRYQVDHEDYL